MSILNLVLKIAIWILALHYLTLKTRLGDILENARKKVSSINFTPAAIEENIPNDPLYPLSQIKTEDIYIDDSLRDLLYSGKPIYFP